MNDTATATSAFQFVSHWKREANSQDDSAVSDFWIREGALPGEKEARERLKEVVMHARNATGAIAGVSTAVAIQLPRLGQPMYYFRCFVGPKWRKSLLVGQLLKRTRGLLERYAQDNDFPCIGMVLELESDRFKDVGRKPVWTTLGQFVYIGKSQRGLDLRVTYFRGARLKNPKA